jgi:hypothetical protein
MLLYPEAAAHLVAEEEAAEAASAPPRGADLAAARYGSLTATSEGRARFSAYLDHLSVTHAHDPVMVAFVRRHRDRLADTAGPAPTDGPARTAPADTTPHAARLDRSPQVAAATEGDPS